MRRAALSAENTARTVLRVHESDAKLIRDSQKFWDSEDDKHLRQHWRGAGIFADEQRWLAWGQYHLEIFDRLTRGLGFAAQVDSMVEWGCGGGANAVHFAPMARKFYGVDIARDNLEECERQLAGIGYADYQPVQIEAADPEAALARIADSIDVFLCLGVFEIFPTPAYGERVLRTAHELLRPGGIAFLNVRYPGDRQHRTKQWGYARNFASNTFYGIDEFWLKLEKAGFEPQSMVLVPNLPINRGSRYAYYLARCVG
jgi:SAM-dependent methyltransferase